MNIIVKYFGDVPRLKMLNIGDWIDLYASEDIDLKAGDFKIIPLGVAMQLPENYEAHIAPRSSAFKHWGILQTNSVGVIDNAYCGDEDMWGMPVYATRDARISKGDRVCQFRIVQNQPFIALHETAWLNNPNRKGFGSTGK